MATWFGCDPELASASASTLAQIKDQIDPVAQWLYDADAAGVPDVVEALSGLADAASASTEDLAYRVTATSYLFSALATGTNDVDESLVSQLGLISG